MLAPVDNFLRRAQGCYTLASVQHSIESGQIIDPVILAEIRRSVQSCVELDKPVLHQIIEEARPLANNQRRIQPRSTTSVSLVAADGGNNDLRFDPFQVQIIRI